MIDRFGQEITIIDNGDGTKTYTRGGIVLEGIAEDTAELNTFNAMAPEGWVEPE